MIRKGMCAPLIGLGAALLGAPSFILLIIWIGAGEVPGQFMEIYGRAAFAGGVLLSIAGAIHRWGAPE